MIVTAVFGKELTEGDRDPYGLGTTGVEETLSQDCEGYLHSSLRTERQSTKPVVRIERICDTFHYRAFHPQYLSLCQGRQLHRYPPPCTFDGSVECADGSRKDFETMVDNIYRRYRHGRGYIFCFYVGNRISSLRSVKYFFSFFLSFSLFFYPGRTCFFFPVSIPVDLRLTNENESRNEYPK